MKTNKVACMSVRAARQDATTASKPLEESPFVLENETAYRRWRMRKLACFAANRDNFATPVTLDPSGVLSEKQHNEITARCRQCNVAFYALEQSDNREFDKSALKRLCLRLGLRTPISHPCADTDAVSSIRVMPKARYIPYTRKPLKWHTDGYYNDDDDTVQAFAMHCVHPAPQGGKNQFFDPEILYILLRDENPDYIVALTHPETLAVPQNPEEATLTDTRTRRSAPVLAWPTANGNLTMRYTQRTRHVIWRDDPLISKARRFISEALDSPSEYRIRCRLDRGQGVICNNVIHNRDGFDDSPHQPRRLLYRVRYRERVAATEYATLST